MAIRVKTNNNTTTVRVGQQNAIKVVASNQSAAVGTVENVANIGGVNTSDRATNTIMLYNGTEYVHVTAAQILDLADNTDDDAIDYGGF